MLFGVSMFVLMAAGGRHWMALGSLCFAVLTKVAALPVLGFYLWRTLVTSGRRGLLTWGGAAVAIAFTAGAWPDKLRMILAADVSGSVDASRLTGTPLFLVFRLLAPFGTDVQAAGYRIALAAALLLVIILAARLPWTDPSLRRFFASNLVFIFAMSMIASPMYQPWYAAWLLPFAVACDDDRLQSFTALFCAWSVAQYGILDSTSGGIFNTLIVVGLLVRYPDEIRRLTSREAPATASVGSKVRLTAERDSTRRDRA
jgi:hypothetical protein